MKQSSDNGLPGPAIAAALLLTAGLITVALWQGANLTPDITPALPGQDLQPENRAKNRNLLIGQIKGTFEKGPGAPGQTPGAWPGFRGPESNNIVPASDVKLLPDWTTRKPETLWTVALGEGHAAPAIMDGRVYLLDYDEEKQADTLRCLSLENGEEIWRRSYRVPMKRNHGLSRTVPAVSEQFVVTLGPRCHVLCVDTQSGAFLWGKDLQADFGTREPFWYAGQCPLIDDGVAVIAPAGKEILMMGIDCATGDILWETPNARLWEMSHSSVMPMTLENTRMYVYCAIGGIAGIAADGPQQGDILWQITDWAPSVVAPSPVVSDTGKIFATAGYGAGSALIQVTRETTGFSAKIIEQFGPKEGLASEQQTPILVDKLLFAILPKDAGARRNQFVCAPLDDPQKILAESGKTARFGLGPFLRVGRLFLVLNDDGTLVLADFSPQGYNELGREKILDGRDAWGPLALVQDRLLLRDDKTLACIRLPLDE